MNGRGPKPIEADSFEEWCRQNGGELVAPSTRGPREKGHGQKCRIPDVKMGPGSPVADYTVDYTKYKKWERRQRNRGGH